MGPTILPKLIKELFNPIAMPCPCVARFEINEAILGRSIALLITKKPVVSMTVVRSVAVNISKNPTELAISDVLITAESPHLLMAGPVKMPCTIAEEIPITVSTNPTVFAS